MTNPNDPVFPLDVVKISDFLDHRETGLTKREEFAKAAMEGLQANPCMMSYTSEKLAAMAVQGSDALIAALNNPAKE